MARIIKKYPNRKLYDVEASRTITLSELSQLIKEGFDIKVIDNETGEDITDITLVEVLRYELRDGKEFASFPFIIKEMIKAGRSTLYEFIKSSLVASVEAMALTEKKIKELVRGLVDRKKIGKKEAEELEEVLLQAVRERQKLLEEKIRAIVEENTLKIMAELGIETKEDLEKKIEEGSMKILDRLGVRSKEDIDRKVEYSIRRIVEELKIPTAEEMKELKKDIEEIKSGISFIVKELKKKGGEI